MSKLAADLLDAIVIHDQPAQLPLVRQFLLPPPRRPDQRGNNFGAMILDDGSVGLTYLALDNALNDLQNNPVLDTLSGASVIDITTWYERESGWQRALGLAAINAVSQHYLRGCNQLVPMTDTLPILLPADESEGGDEHLSQDHFGMVGYFGRLIDPMIAMGARITVIELNEQLVRKDGNLTVTLDNRQLADCNKVIITGTTLLNHTLDNILQQCTGATKVLMLGPTASCLPQPLFDRGVTMVGGFHVTDADAFTQRWLSGESWRQCGFRYLITRTAPALN
jgi:uncharacterized protein (DUF4213/DUF364 family)